MSEELPASEGIELPVDYNELSRYAKRVIREEYIVRQDGKCWHCGKPLNEFPPVKILIKPIKRHLFPANFFKYPIHLHHDHNTGMTIGAVHCECNAVLWQYHGE